MNSANYFAWKRSSKKFTSSLLEKLLIARSYSARFLSQDSGQGIRAAGCDVARTILCESDKEATRECTEGKAGTGVSQKKPKGSGRERIGTAGGRLLPVATGVGRGRYWSSSSRMSRLATNVSLAVT